MEDRKFERAPGGSGPHVMSAGFPHAKRLLKHGDFDRVYRQGQRLFSGHITVFYLRREAGEARVGFTVSRAMGGAVERNRIRRRLREAVRSRLCLLARPVDVVINPRKPALAAEFSVLRNEVERAFELIARRIGA